MKTNTLRFKVLAITISAIFLITTIGQDAAHALQPDLQLARPGFAAPYLVRYGVDKTDKLVSLLEEEGSLTFSSVEDLLEREVFLKKDILDLEFNVNDGEVLIEIADGMVLRIFDPERRPYHPIDTIPAEKLYPQRKLNDNLFVALLYKEKLYSTICSGGLSEEDKKLGRRLKNLLDIMTADMDPLKDDLEEEVRLNTMQSVTAHIDENMNTIAGFVSFFGEITVDSVEAYLLEQEGLPEDWRDAEVYGKLSSNIEHLIVGIRELALEEKDARAEYEEEAAIEELLDDDKRETAERAQQAFFSIKKDHLRLAKQIDSWLNDPEFSVHEVYLKLIGSGVNNDLFKRGILSYENFRATPGFGAFLDSEYLPMKLTDDILGAYSLEHLRELKEDIMLEIFVEDELHKIFLPEDWWTLPAYGKYIRRTRQIIREVALALEEAAQDDSVDAGGDVDKDVGPGTKDEIKEGAGTEKVTGEERKAVTIQGITFERIRDIILETKKDCGDWGVCTLHSEELLRRLAKEGIYARVMKIEAPHYWVETDKYVIDAFPEGMLDEYVKEAGRLGDERYIFVEKDSDTARSKYAGVEDEVKTQRAIAQKDDDAGFYQRKKDYAALQVRERKLLLAQREEPDLSEIDKDPEVIRWMRVLDDADKQYKRAVEKKRMENLAKMNDMGVDAAGEADREQGPGAEEDNDLTESMDADIEALLKVRPSVYRDNHTNRVRGIALLLAQKMGIFDDAMLEKIEYVALLHDIGGRPVPVTHEKVKWLNKSLALKGIDIDRPKGYGMEDFYILKARLENNPDVTEEERDLAIHEVQAANSIHVIEKSGIFFGSASRDVQNAILFHHNIAYLDEYLTGKGVLPEERERTLLLASILVAADVAENGINLLRKKFYYQREEIEGPLETLRWLEKSDIPDESVIDAFKKLFDAEKDVYTDEVMKVLATDGAMLHPEEVEYLEEAVHQREEALRAIEELEGEDFVDASGDIDKAVGLSRKPFLMRLIGRLLQKLTFILGLISIMPGTSRAEDNRLSPIYYPPTQRDRLVLEENRLRDSLRVLSHTANWVIDGQYEDGSSLMNYMSADTGLSRSTDITIHDMSYEDLTYSVLNKGLIDPVSDIFNDNEAFRLAKYMLWDIPFADLAVVSWHERGHQIRKWEAGGDGYLNLYRGYPFFSFQWDEEGDFIDKPFGSDEWYKYRLLSLGDGLATESYMADQVRRKMFSGEARYNDSLIYIRAKLGLPAYIFSDIYSANWKAAEENGWQELESTDKGGIQDVYGHYYNSRKRYNGEAGYTRNDLMLLAAWEVLDPHLYYAFRQNVEYLVTGEDAMTLPAFIPYTRGFLTPEGVRMDLRFAFRRDFWSESPPFEELDLYLYRVKGGEGEIYGVGANVYGWRFSESFRTDLEVAGWYHPDDGLAGSIRIAPTLSIGRFDISAGLVYKDEGYVPGEMYEEGLSGQIKIEFGRGKERSRRVRRNYFRPTELYCGVAGLLGAAVAGLGMVPISTSVIFPFAFDAFSLAIVSMVFIAGVSVLAYLWEYIVDGVQYVFKRREAGIHDPEEKEQTLTVEQEPPMRKATEEDITRIRDIFAKAKTRVGFVEGIEALSEIVPEDRDKVLEGASDAFKREVAIQFLTSKFEPSSEASEYDISGDETILQDRMFDLAREQCIMAHGVEGPKGGIWSLLNIILSRKISGYAPGWGLLDGKVILPEMNSGLHGPFWVTFNEPKGKEWKEAENHNYYIVPREASKRYILDAMAIAVEEGIIDTDYFNSARAKVVTYAEFVGILSGQGSSGISAEKERVKHPAENNDLYADLPDDRKLSINDIMAYTAKVSEEIAFRQKDTKEEFISAVRSYLAQNKKFVGAIYRGEEDPVILRVPIELLENDEYEGTSEWLNAMVKTGIVMVELYTVQDPDADIAMADIYQQYGIVKSDIDIEKTKLNTVSLFAASKDMNKKDLQDKLLFCKSLRNSVVVPVGIKGDPTGVIRGAVFGMRLVHIARDPKDAEFIEETLNQYNNIITSYRMKSAAISREDILALVEKTPGINNLVTALKHIIETLPIERISADEIRNIYERARLVAQAA